MILIYGTNEMFSDVNFRNSFIREFSPTKVGFRAAPSFKGQVELAEKVIVLTDEWPEIVADYSALGTEVEVRGMNEPAMEFQSDAKRKKTKEVQDEETAA